MSHLWGDSACLHSFIPTFYFPLFIYFYFFGGCGSVESWKWGSWMISALFNIAGNLILLAQGKNPCLDIGESSDPSRKMCFEKGWKAGMSEIRSWSVRARVPWKGRYVRRCELPWSCSAFLQLQPLGFKHILSCSQSCTLLRILCFYYFMFGVAVKRSF